MQATIYPDILRISGASNSASKPLKICILLGRDVKSPLHGLDHRKIENPPKDQTDG
jgi:hypothetical protein